MGASLRKNGISRRPNLSLLVTSCYRNRRTCVDQARTRPKQAVHVTSHPTQVDSPSPSPTHGSSSTNLSNVGPSRLVSLHMRPHLGHPGPSASPHPQPPP
eukprot:363580-Chlamydomonas_euryale.AAC.12